MRRSISLPEHISRNNVDQLSNTRAGRNKDANPPILECSTNMRLIDCPAFIRSQPAIHALELQRTFIFSQKRRFLRSVGEEPHREHAKQNRRDALDDEEETPIMEWKMRVLDPECEEAAKCST